MDNQPVLISTSWRMPEPYGLSELLAQLTESVGTMDATELAQFLIDFDAVKRTFDESQWVAGLLAEKTLDDHMAISKEVLRLVVEAHREERDVTGVVGLYSGGDDSSTFVHMFRDHLTHVGHVDTTIGVPETQTHVRRVCELFDIPLIIKSPPAGCTYDEVVLKWGFPGPAGHRLMYNRLKERALHALRREFVQDHASQRVVFVGGMRHHESQRRMRNTQVTTREGSIVWCAPIAWWPTRLLKEYRERFEVPRNEVAANLHMSGECLCGAFAAPGELDMIDFFYPDVSKRIRALEVRAEAAGVHCKWGTRPPATECLVEQLDVGPICSKCEQLAMV